MLCNFSLEEIKEELKSRGYSIIPIRKDGIRSKRESYEGSKPKRNTFESRRKRMGGSYAKTPEDRDRIIALCISKPIGHQRRKV